MANKKIKVARQCPLCRKITELSLDKEAYERYESGNEAVQVCFPDESAFVREALINNICFDCQSDMYHRPKPGEEESWGKEIGECCNCARPVYEKDIKDEKFVCGACGEKVYYAY